jgi:hypothetical protein
VETDPTIFRAILENLLKERIPWKEPDGTTVLPDEILRDSSQMNFKSQSGEEILRGD